MYSVLYLNYYYTCMYYREYNFIIMNVYATTVELFEKCELLVLKKTPPFNILPINF